MTGMMEKTRIRVVDRVAVPDEDWNAEIPNPATSSAAYRVYNIGNSTPIKLMDFIRSLEEACGKEAVKEYLPMQPGDVYQTWADTTRLQEDYGYTPQISLETGIARFAKWFKSYNK